MKACNKETGQHSGVRKRETSVNNYHKTPCNYPEDHRFYQHRGGSLKSSLPLQYFVIYLFIYLFIYRQLVGEIAVQFLTEDLENISLTTASRTFIKRSS
jgi:hypothetical protein